MIRVLQVHCEFMPQSSGVARHMDGMAQALAGGGEVEPTVFAQRVGPVGERGYRVLAGSFAGLPAQVGACDVVHAHGARTAISAAALRLARLLGKPAVFTPHCYYRGGGWGRRLGKRVWDVCVERSSVGGADAVILLHPGWAGVLRGMNFRPRRIEVIPNCIDADAILARLAAAPALRLSGRPALLSVGRIDRVKRLDDAIRALTEPGLGRAELHIVGQGGDDARLKTLAASLGLAGRVHFLGWRDDRETAAMMRGCDAMVLASEQEGLPTVLLEALLARIPMVVSDIAGNRAVADAVGWRGIFPLGDTRALAACTLDSLSSPVGAPVADAVRDRFSWQGRVGEVAALYRDLTARKKAGPG
jgi:Glycosyltransferase